MNSRPLYGLAASLSNPPILNESLLAEFQDDYRNLTDEELLAMVSVTETIQ